MEHAEQALSHQQRPAHPPCAFQSLLCKFTLKGGIRLLSAEEISIALVFFLMNNQIQLEPNQMIFNTSKV